MNITEKDSASHARDLTRRIAEADRSRHASLELAAAQLEATRESLRVERIRLVHRYGPAHARVAQIDARISAAADERRDTAAELQRSSLEAPRAAASVATLHGRIVDPNELGIQGATVRARRSDGAEAGRVETNDVGHFVLSFPQDKRATGTVDILLDVLLSSRRVAHHDTAPRQLQPGSVEYTEIEIAGGGKGGDRQPPGGQDEPPPGSRSTTLPRPTARRARSGPFSDKKGST